MPPRDGPGRCRPSQPRARFDRPEEAVARLVLDRSLAVHAGENVTIETWSSGLPWARAFVLEARRRGARPTLVVEDEEAFFRSIPLSPGRPVPMASTALAATSDAYVYLGGPEQFPRLRGLPDRDLEAILARHDPAWWRAARRVGLRAANLAIAGVTATAAERFDVDLHRWRTEVIRASLVDPGALARAAGPVLRAFAPGRRIRLRHGNGTDLTATVGRAPGWVEDGRIGPADRRAGRIWTQVPNGLVAVPLTPGSVEGTWETNRPIYDRFSDPGVSLGARFTFRSGRLEEFSFERGGESFAAQYAEGGPEREVPGVLTVGLNPHIAHAPELGEIAAGAIGLLLGDPRPTRRRDPQRFSYLTTLAGADIELDGVRWSTGRGRGPGRRA